MKHRRNIILFIIFSALATIDIYAQLPAFPGALGWGALAVGGRGGTVIEVTNLNDAGPGSFREAINTPGARIIVFRTGGIINLLSEIQLTYPYVYIAGQTAPGDGILLKNFSLSIFTHDVIIRGLRIRVGDDFPDQSPDNRDCLTIEGASYNVIVDHCSFSWGVDENVSLWDSTVHSVTVQWCIISEGLYKSIHPKGPHSMGLLIGNGATKTSVHHNLFAHNADRNPMIKGYTDHEVVNNIIYDWKFSNNLLEDGHQIKVDLVGNYWKPYSYNPAPELPLTIDFDSTTTLGSRLFIENNLLSPSEFFLTPAQISAFGGNAILFSTTSLLSAATTLNYQTPYQAYDTVLQWAGALHPQRDTADKRILKSVADSSGRIIDCIGAAPIFLDSGKVLSATDTSFTYSVLTHPLKYSVESRRIEITGGKGTGQVRTGTMVNVVDTVSQIVEGFIDAAWATRPDSTSTYKLYAACQNNLGGWPAYNSGTPIPDSDNDGMPDTWETSHGLNPFDATDRNGTTLNNQGYTNLEVYLNELYTPTLNNVDENFSSESLRIQLKPNPAKEKLEVEFSPMKTRAIDFEIFTVLGNKIYSRHLESISEAIVDVQHLSAGLYFIKISDSEQSVQTKFIKE